MSDLLRRAATKLREQAQAATIGPWSYDPTMQWHLPVDLAYSRNGEEYVRAYGPVCVAATGPANDPQSMTDARYIALMHPPVALALADLLTVLAMMPSASDPTDMHVAVTLARAILREDADAA